MLERQEKTALFMLVGVVAVIFVAHFILDALAMPAVATPYSVELPDGRLTVIEGRVEDITETATGGHIILTIDGITVFLPANVAATLEVYKDDTVTLYGTVQTYRGKREVVVNSARDIQVRG